MFYATQVQRACKYYSLVAQRTYVSYSNDVWQETKDWFTSEMEANMQTPQRLIGRDLSPSKAAFLAAWVRRKRAAEFVSNRNYLEQSARIRLSSVVDEPRREDKYSNLHVSPSNFHPFVDRHTGDDSQKS